MPLWAPLGLSFFILQMFAAWPSQAFSAGTLQFYKQQNPPKYFPVGAEHLGICGEIYAALQSALEAEGVSVQIDHQLYPVSRIKKVVEKSSNGVYCGAGRNAKREALYHFSAIPVYDVANQLVAHRDDSYDPLSFDDLAASGDLIGGRYATSSTRYLQQQSGLLIEDQFETLDQGLALLATQRRIRWFFYHDLGIFYALKHSDLPLRVVPTKLRSYSHWMIYSRSMPEDHRRALDRALLSMQQSGQLAEIEQRYKRLD